MYFYCLPNRNQKTYFGYPMIGKFNLEANTFERIVSLPQVYDAGFWSSLLLFKPFFTYNDKKNTMVVSFPVTPYLYETDLDGKILNNFYVGSKFFGKTKPMYEDMDYQFNKARNFDKEADYTFSNSRYSKIHYDKVNKQYFRITNPEKEKINVNDRDRNSDFTIIVTDENFIKIAEKKFNYKKYDIHRSGFINGTVYLARKDLYAEDENHMFFSKFKLTFD